MEARNFMMIQRSTFATIISVVTIKVSTVHLLLNIILERKPIFYQLDIATYWFNIGGKYIMIYLLLILFYKFIMENGFRLVSFYPLHYINQLAGWTDLLFVHENYYNSKT